jgi:hypothetical protein
MLSLSRSTSRSGILRKKLSSTYSHSDKRIAAHTHGRPHARAMSELIDKQYTKLTQIDHVLVRYYHIRQTDEFNNRGHPVEEQNYCENDYTNLELIFMTSYG